MVNFLWLILAMLLTWLLMPQFISFFQAKKLGQTTREEGPLWHEAKTGTPTMGGTVFISLSILVMLLMLIFTQEIIWPSLTLLLTLFLFGLIGFVDDFISIFKKQNEGLKAKQKFALQIIFALLVSLFAIMGGQTLTVPLFNYQITQLWLIVPFAIIWINGFSNAVNLTDGLDGLATSLNIIAYATYACLSFIEGEWLLGQSCLIVVGSLIAFLYYNRKPARIFMGDVGSLALGAGLAVVSLLLNNPWSLIIVGIVFVIETLSVILQVWSFKTRGKRIFKMSPIHHHFEMIGWSENKVMLRFCLVGFLASLLILVLNVL
ncbi:phospho-N-acetylmuramoyl-pentapeptide-transferase [Ignavigranum ruoffiae]|uniref:phospho-N-acetylmuramoyl-pentapeptide- transferase n=1 Tax=Ignavigranum ruoffiae TaxID=89093 RepID=UPI002354290C|nr:phospho-N-acetylmuramoyl-pentapeptide-transferase [Ignavigranum ruoffiae]